NGHGAPCAQALHAQYADARLGGSAQPVAAACDPCQGQQQQDDEDQAQDQAKQGGLSHGGSAAVVQAGDPVRGGDDVGDADTVFFLDDDDLTLGDQVPVHVDVHGLAGEAVELDDRALPQLQNVLDGQAGAAELDRKLDRN